MSTNNCNNCGKSHFKKFAFGQSADNFFFQPTNVNMGFVKQCLKTAGYGNQTPLTRFGNNKNSLGPMKIGTKKTKK